MSLILDKAEYCLNLVKDWEDPNPDPIIETLSYSGLNIVRDDLFEWGSKARFADFFVKTSKSDVLVYGGSPANGYAAISLGYLAKKYGKKVLIFAPLRSEKTVTPYQRKAMDIGCEFMWVKCYGSILPCIKAAEQFYLECKKSMLVPFGLNEESVLGSIIKIARNLECSKPKRVFCVAGSGCLAEGLALAFPESEIHVVQVGKKVSLDSYSNVVLYKSEYGFKKNIPIKESPSYPSILSYDAKVWPIAMKFGKPTDLVWNVGAPL